MENGSGLAQLGRDRAAEAAEIVVDHVLLPVVPAEFASKLEVIRDDGHEKKRMIKNERNVLERQQFVR